MNTTLTSKLQAMMRQNLPATQAAGFNDSILDPLTNMDDWRVRSSFTNQGMHNGDGPDEEYRFTTGAREDGSGSVYTTNAGRHHKVAAGDGTGKGSWAFMKSLARNQTPRAQPMTRGLVRSIDRDFSTTILLARLRPLIER